MEFDSSILGRLAILRRLSKATKQHYCANTLTRNGLGSYNPFTIEHVQGGKSTLDNCQVLQATVNRSKGNRTELTKAELIEKSSYCRVSGRDMDMLELSAFGNVRRGQDSGGCNIQYIFYRSLELKLILNEYPRTPKNASLPVLIILSVENTLAWADSQLCDWREESERSKFDNYKILPTQLFAHSITISRNFIIRALTSFDEVGNFKEQTMHSRKEDLNDDLIKLWLT
ncbi:hypothetical protein Leryth_014242 [Lithospermum erythrorhizon]|nr:hypothetical protein Leryth_014242 [Lithospermum erythrorhizon]